MPVILAALVRPVIVFLLQMAGTAIAGFALEKILYAVIDALQKYYEIPEDDAVIITANWLAWGVAYTVGGAATIQSKLPVTLARKLGFSGDKIARRVVSEATAKKILAVDAVAKTGGAKKALETAFKVIAIPGGIVWLMVGLANVIEPGIYKPEQTNAVYEQLGIPWKYPTNGGSERLSTFTAKEWREFITGLQQAGVTGLRDDTRGTTLSFNERNAAALLVRLSGQAALKGENLTPKKAKEAIAPYLVRNGIVDETKVQQAIKGTSAVGAAAANNTQSVAQQVKIVAREVLPFEPRDNDIIESEEELRQAAHNNLSAFISALGGRIACEIRTVPNIKLRDGNIVYGTNVQVQSGIDSKGNPKMKTVRTKFAVLDVYVLDENGKRLKVQTITLGPTDAANYNPSSADLADVGDTLQTQQVITSTVRSQNTAQVTIETTPQNPLGDAEQGADVPTITQTPVLEREYLVNGDGFYDAVRFRVGDVVYETTFVDDMLSDDEKLKLGNYGKMIEEVQRRLLQMGIDVEKFKRDSFYWEYQGRAATMKRYPWQQFFFERLPNESGATSSPVTTVKGSEARSLSEWYTANGQTLPSISARGVIYESYGLGSKSLYTGTAEQNTKLLAALKLQK